MCSWGPPVPGSREEGETFIVDVTVGVCFSRENPYFLTNLFQYIRCFLKIRIPVRPPFCFCLTYVRTYSHTLPPLGVKDQVSPRPSYLRTSVLTYTFITG